MSSLQWQEDTPGVCENKECENYKAFELYDVAEVKTEDLKEYVTCFFCKEKIYLH